MNASLAAIEARLAKAEQSEMRGTPIAAGLAADLRTLINEVKGYRQAEATLNRVDEVRTEKLRALEAEVKELREEKHFGEPCQRCGKTDGPVWWVEDELWNSVMGTPANPRGEGIFRCVDCFVAESRVPMEEALREIAAGTALEGKWLGVCDPLRSVARAVLSPSDTEEEA